MMRIRAPFVALLSIAVLATPAAALETLYLVRHSETVESWPEGAYLDPFRPLDADGVARAEALAGALADAGVAAIYASRTTRALQTAVPLSDRAGLTIRVDSDTVDSGKMRAFLADLGKRHEGDEAVLIVGHSNTVPELLVRLGAVPDCFPEIGIRETPSGLRIDGHDGLWKIDLKGSGCARIERRKFGL